MTAEYKEKLIQPEEPKDEFRVAISQPDKIYQLGQDLLFSGEWGVVEISDTDLDGDNFLLERTAIEIIPQLSSQHPTLTFSSEVVLGTDIIQKPERSFYSRERVSRIQELLRIRGTETEMVDEGKGFQLLRRNGDDILEINFGYETAEIARDTAVYQMAKLRAKGLLDRLASRILEGAVRNHSVAIELYPSEEATATQQSRQTDIYTQAFGFVARLSFYASLYEEVIRALYNEQGFNPPAQTVIFRPVVKSSDTLEELHSLRVSEPLIVTQEQLRGELPKLDDVKGQSTAVAEARALVASINNSELYEKRGIRGPKGILFFGPPGTGKTMLAKAIVREVNAEFMSIYLPDVLSKWYGESTRLMQEVFNKANGITSKGRHVVLFIDEIDVLVPHRDGAHEATQGIISVLLQNLDGLQANPSVTFICATNRPDAIDPALKRAGRIDKLIEVGLPRTLEDRAETLNFYVNKIKNRARGQGGQEELFDPELDLTEVAAMTDNMSHADLENIVYETIRIKTDAEILHGELWKPVTADDLKETVNKIRHTREQKRRLGFVSSS